MQTWDVILSKQSASVILQSRHALPLTVIVFKKSIAKFALRRFWRRIWRREVGSKSRNCRIKSKCRYLYSDASMEIEMEAIKQIMEHVLQLQDHSVWRTQTVESSFYFCLKDFVPFSWIHEEPIGSEEITSAWRQTVSKRTIFGRNLPLLLGMWSYAMHNKLW